MGISDSEIYKGITKFFKSLLCERIRLVVCSIVVALLIIVDIIGIVNGWMVLDVHPVLAFVLLIGALLILAMVEALHYSCVSMEKLDVSHLKETHPTCVACQELINTPDKVKRFLNGRQFFVIFVVFLIAQLTNFPGFPKDFGGFSEGFNYFLSKSGIPGVALVLTVGQLISQLYVEEYMLLFMERVPFCYSMIQICFAVEWIGTTHFAWALYEGSARLFCMKVRRKAKDMDEVMSPTEALRGPDFDLGVEEGSMDAWTAFRYLWSTFVCVSSCVILGYGIANEHYILHAPAAVGFLIAIFGLILLFYLEGLMIAIAATQYWDREAFKEAYPRAYEVHAIVTQPDNLKRFIIGRQFMTVLTGFMLAEVFTFAYWDKGDYNATAFWIIVQSGLVGVLIVLSFGQLNPELLAAEYPLRFMNMRGSYTIVYLSLLFDAIGVGHAGWSVYYVTRPLLCSATEMDNSEEEKPHIFTPASAELFHKTGSPYGAGQASGGSMGNATATATANRNSNDSPRTGL